MEGDLDTIGLVAFYEETLACSLPLSTSLSLSPPPPPLSLPPSFSYAPSHRGKATWELTELAATRQPRGESWK